MRKLTTEFRSVLKEIQGDLPMTNKIYSDGRNPDGKRAVGIKVVGLKDMGDPDIRFLISRLIDKGIKTHYINKPSNQKKSWRSYYEGMRFTISWID